MLKALTLSKEISYEWEQCIYPSNNKEAVKKPRKVKLCGSINCDVKTTSRNVLFFFSNKYAKPLQTKNLLVPTTPRKLMKFFLQENTDESDRFFSTVIFGI